MSNSHGLLTSSLLVIGLVSGCTSSSANQDKPVISDSVDDFPLVTLVLGEASEGELSVVSLALDNCEVTLAHALSKTDAQDGKTDAQDAMVVDAPPSSTTPVDRKTYTCNKAELEKGRLLFSKDRIEPLRNLSGQLHFSIIWPDMDTLDSFSVPRDSNNPAVEEVVEYLRKLDSSYWSAP